MISKRFRGYVVATKRYTKPRLLYFTYPRPQPEMESSRTWPWHGGSSKPDDHVLGLGFHVLGLPVLGLGLGLGSGP